MVVFEFFKNFVRKKLGTHVGEFTSCKNCDGKGGWVESCIYPEFPDEVTLCPECVGQGKCPRCGNVIVDTAEGFSYLICSRCGWKEDDIKEE